MLSLSTLVTATSGVPAWLGLKAVACGLAFDSSGFQNLQAGPELSMTAGFGSALAQAMACGVKMHYKSNISSMERCSPTT